MDANALQNETSITQIDWQQVALNGGPPCFFVEGPQYCGRAERWPGHGNEAFHDYVSLDNLLATGRAEASTAMRDKCVEKVKELCNEWQQKHERLNTDADLIEKLSLEGDIRVANTIIAALSSLTLDQVKPGEM